MPDTRSRTAIETLVCNLLDTGGEGSQVTEWEQELNALVYEVYGLTEREIAVIAWGRTAVRPH